ncbi:unnamed protein product [Urochloa humidicola]
MIIAWRLDRLRPVRKLEGNRFIIEFETEDEYNYVINGGPWKHKGDALIVVPYDGITRPSEVIIDSVNLWVRFYDVPVTLLNEIFTGVLARKVSKKVLEIGRPGGNYLRARVAFPLEEAIIPTVDAKVKGLGLMTFQVKYENAPFFCFNCGRMGHAKKECPEETEEEEEEDGSDAVLEEGHKRKKFGEWLRKTPPKRGEDRQLIFPTAPTRANRALNFSGDQLLRIQAASSATRGTGGGRKESMEKQPQKFLLGYVPDASPRKLPRAVSSALSESMNRMAVEEELEKNRVSGLDSYAGSSEGFGMSSGNGKPPEFRSIHDWLQAAKAAKGKAASDKKLHKGPSPVKEIGKAKRGKLAGKAGATEQLQSLMGAAAGATPATSAEKEKEKEGEEVSHNAARALNLTGTHEESRQKQ